MSEAVYRYLGRQPEYQPTKFSIVGGFGSQTERSAQFLEKLGASELDELDDFTDPVLIIGSGKDKSPRPERADKKLKKMFGTWKCGETNDKLGAGETNDNDDQILYECPRFEGSNFEGGDSEDGESEESSSEGNEENPSRVNDDDPINDNIADDQTVDNEAAAGIIVGGEDDPNDTDLSSLLI